MFRNESTVIVFRADVISRVNLTEYQHKKSIGNFVNFCLYKALKAENYNSNFHLKCYFCLIFLRRVE